MISVYKGKLKCKENGKYGVKKLSRYKKYSCSSITKYAILKQKWIAIPYKSEKWNKYKHNFICSKGLNCWV